jgi:hypothetical protein
MTIEPEHRLHTIAQAIADETPVDWDRALADTPSDASTLGNLRALAALARANRAPEEDDASPELFRWGPLSVREQLGAGSFGEVYRAWDPSLRREVALKLRRADGGGSDRRWLDEARRLARVRHPNVLAVHGADVHEGRAGLWTDLLSGATLEALLQSRGMFGAREAALIGVELCGALAAVHAAGLVHGDVKTTNVMREGEPGAADGSGRIVLMDFGSAHDPEAGAASFGTPLAIAPEVLKGATATPSSDTYSLGVLLFRLVTGKYPVEASSVSELMERQAKAERASLRTLRPDLPAAFVAAVEKALEPAPSARYADTAALERALVPLLSTAPAATKRSPLVPALAVIVALVAAWLVFAPRTPKRVAATIPVEPPAEPTANPEPPTARAIVVTPPAVEAELVRGEEDLGAPLANGDLVAPGDRLALEMRANEPVYAYVLSEDDKGALFVLFPLRDRGAKNPLSGGKRQRLPGADNDWVVTSAGGRETFLVLAARTPLSSVEEAVAQLPAAREDEKVRYAPLSPRALEGLRAVGGVATSEAPEPARAGAHRLAALAKSLDASPEGRAVWRKLVVLENPSP